MSNEEEGPKLRIAVGVPPDTSIEEIEREINKALSREAPDILRHMQSGSVIIVVENEYHPLPPKSGS